MNKNFENFILNSVLSSPKGMIVFALNTQYKYTFFSKKHSEIMELIWGIRIKLGMNILEVISVEEDRWRAKLNFDKALRGSYLVLREEYGDEQRYRTFWENRYSPIYDDHQQIIGISVFVMDITEHITMEQSLRITIVEREILKEREHLLNSLGEGVYCVTTTGLCTFINPTALQMLDYTKEEVLGQNSHELFHHHFKTGEIFPACQCVIRKTIDCKKQFKQNEWLFRKNGQSFLCRLVATPIMKADDVLCVVIAFSDMTLEYAMQQELHRMNKRLERLSNLDHLTQIYNRRYFEKNVQLQLDNAFREEKAFSMIVFDIDFFKRINDSYGHKVGDRILRLVAKTVLQALPETAIFARIGGEEFAISLFDCDLEAATAFAEKIRIDVEAARLRRNVNEIRCTISMGVASTQKHLSKAELLLNKADKKMYTAKMQGRNRVVS